VLLKNPFLIADAGKLIYKLLPSIQDSPKGTPISLSSAQLDDITSFLIRFENEASPGFKQSIRQMRMSLGSEKILEKMETTVRTR
jgi:hypothetical protein